MQISLQEYLKSFLHHFIEDIWTGKDLHTYKKQTSQFTSTLTVWFTSFPMPLLALQRYFVPSLVLLLGSINCSPVNSISLSVPLANTFVQVMFGTGSPSAVQVKLIAEPPSSTTWFGALVINEGGSENESRIKESYL